jgi:hypothetical protein
MQFIKNEKGQVVVSVILVMMIALAIGIGISTNFVKTLRISTRSDASSRAFTVAEALIENILSIPYETLYEYIQFNSCGSDCYLEILGDDGVLAVATATLSVAGDSPNPYPASLSTGAVVEINVRGYPDDTNLYVCWNDPSVGESPSVVSQLLHGTSGNYNLDLYAVNSVSSTNSANGFDSASPMGGYENCFPVDSNDTPVALRLRSVYNDVDAFVVPESSEEIPSQGIIIEAEGTFLDTVKKVEVLKGEPFLPLPFDYALYSKSASEPLSN